MPILDGPGHKELVQTMKALVNDLPKKLSVIVMVSAHWETSGFELTAAANHDIIYNYYGFPEESYHLQYPAPGAPELARSIADKMETLGTHIRLNESCDFDYSMFIPLMLMYPDANISVLQLSLNSSLNPEKYWQLGEQLAQVLPEDALLMGSGFSFHNMRAFFNPQALDKKASVNAFQVWLDETVTGADISVAESKQRWDK